jgi:hypothetical protein
MHAHLLGRNSASCNMSLIVRSPYAPAGQSAATRETPGMASLRSSIRLGTRAGPRKLDPVIFLSGCARLATTPSLTGSPIPGAMTGIVMLACFAARATGVPPRANRRSILRRALGDEVRETLGPSLRGSVLDYDVLTLHIAEVAQPLS